MVVVGAEVDVVGTALVVAITLPEDQERVGLVAQDG